MVGSVNDAPTHKSPAQSTLRRAQHGSLPAQLVRAAFAQFDLRKLRRHRGMTMPLGECADAAVDPRCHRVPHQN
ncbi:Uncharacterised protein [Vibrio cholerae]|nr:Uncharacterised protein [Vibrio cholerae]